MAKTDLRKKVVSMLESGSFLNLATKDEYGVWVCTVIYVFDDKLNLYWLSYRSTRHSIAISKNPEIAANIVLTKRAGEPIAALQIEGSAEKISGDLFEMAVKDRQKRNKLLPKRPGEILDSGESWYKLTPTRILITDELSFGMRKMALEL